MNQGSSRENQLLANFAAILSSTLVQCKDGGGLISLQKGQDVAQQLQHVISPSVGSDVKCCSVPCMSLKHQGKSASSSSTRSSLEQVAAVSLATSLEVAKMDLVALPTVLVRNIADTFMSLVGSRIRSYVTAMMSQSMNQDQANRKQVLLVANLLASSSSTLIKPTAIVSSFRMMDTSTLSAGNHQVSPLVQETIMDLNVLGQMVTVKVKGTGSIIGVFDEGGPQNTKMIAKVSVLLDTAGFLNSMMTEVREAVRKAVAITSNVVIQNNPVGPIAATTTGSKRSSSTNISNGLSSYNICNSGENGSELPPKNLLVNQGGQQEFPTSLHQMVGGNGSDKGMSFPPAQRASEANISNVTANTLNGSLLESQFVSSRVSGGELTIPRDGGISLLTRAAGTLKHDLEGGDMMDVSKRQQQIILGGFDLSKRINQNATTATVGVSNFEEV